MYLRRILDVVDFETCVDQDDVMSAVDEACARFVISFI